MDWKSLSVTFRIGLAMASLTACAGSLTVRTPDQAVALAKRMCGHLIPASHASSVWTAEIGDGHEVFWNIPGGVWRVGARYDGSYTDSSNRHIRSIVDTLIFIPKVGKPSGCIQVSN
jgi:hypothetical protein